MKPKGHKEVLVVGAGPVGLAGALAMARRGLDVEIVDKDRFGSAHSYALALHPGTLELLDRFELTSELMEAGRRIERIAYYRGSERLGELRLSELDSEHPYVLVLPQSRLEQALERRLQALGVRVLWNHQLTALEPADDGFSAEIARMDKVSLGYPIARTEWVVGKRFATRAGFLVGADGYHSFVRRTLGLRYEDLDATASFSVFEFAAPEGTDEARVVFHNGTLNAYWPMADGRARWSFQTDASPSRLTLTELHEFLGERVPWFGAEPDELYWSTTVRFERRLAERFGRDRACLAGDAAHITGPIGAQSMNVGMREVDDLAERIREVAREGAPPETLEVYRAERLEEWEALLTSGKRLELAEDAPHWVREQAREIVPTVPASGEHLRPLLRQFGLRLV